MSIWLYISRYIYYTLVMYGFKVVNVRLRKGGINMDTLWLFPGQGGQKPQMLAPVEPKLRKLVEEISQTRLLDTKEAYQDTLQIQLSLLTLQLDQIDKLKSKGFEPTIVAGHSLGVFSAAYAGGFIAKEDVIALVAKRAKLMQASYPAGYGMGVVTGLTVNEVAKLVQQVNSPTNSVYTSNQNEALQITVSGKLTAIQTVLDLALQNGANKAKLLNVPTPSHCPLMQNCALELAQFAQKITLKKSPVIYLANYNGRRAFKLEDIMYDLTHNLAYPVYWDLMTNLALEYRPKISLEFQPGKTFTNLLKNKDRDDLVRKITIQDKSLEDIFFLLEKWTLKS